MDERAERYHVLVAEAVPDEVLRAMFEEVRPLDPTIDGSVLVSSVRDQEQLVGILSRLSLLGYTVLEVRRTRAP